MAAPGIAIVTADLHAGETGVGDYCLCLGAALAEAGQRVRLAALASPRPGTPDADLECLASQPWSQRMRRLEEALADWRPDWVFLQSMPQLYHPKAWLGRQAAGFAEALAGQRVAVMLHELESSLEAGGDPAARRRQARQFRASLALLAALGPGLVVTSNALYRRRLETAGRPAEILPLFSHLPVSAEPPGPWLAAAIAAGGGPAGLEDWALIGMMGRVAEDWRPEACLAEAAAAARRAGRRPLLLLAGHSGVGPVRLSAWRAALPDLPMLDLGPLPAERMVQLLNALSLLVSQTPFALLGKSSIVAAALAQGVPVLAGRGSAAGEPPLAGWPDALVLAPGVAPDAAFARQPGSGPFDSRRSAVAARLIALLRAAEGRP